MDHKKSPKGKKRQSKQIEDTLWECSACTYRNNPEAFKCSMCSIRKGTSTRKTKLNPDMVEVQVQKHAFTPPSPHVRFPREDMRDTRPASSDAGHAYHDDAEEAGPSSASKAKKLKTSAAVPKPRTPKTPGTAAGVVGSRGKLKNIDRKNATVHSVTVDNVTINITEYKLKHKKEKKGEAEGAAAVNHLVSDADSDTQEPSSQNLESFQGTRSS